jgi:hypothetical protein
MLLNERKLNLMLTKLYSEFPHETVDELSLKIRNALHERSGQAEKVLQLQKFIENVYPKEMQTGEHVVDIAKRLLSESLLVVFNEDQELTPEEIETNERLLKILHEQFTTHYRTFDGSFDEWLELRGLSFEKDRFFPIYLASKPCEAGRPKQIDFQRLTSYVISLTNSVQSFLDWQHNKQLKKLNKKKGRKVN